MKPVSEMDNDDLLSKLDCINHIKLYTQLSSKFLIINFNREN